MSYSAEDNLMMSKEQVVEGELAGETELMGKNLT
jgi:hypothetical protein